MLGRLNLEEKTYEEFNRQCDILNLPVERSPNGKMFAFIREPGPNTKNSSAFVNLRLVYSDIIDLHNYFHRKETIVSCIHPFEGRWGVGDSESKTFDDRRNYVDMLKGMGFDRFMLRVEKRKGFIPAVGRQRYTDVFTFLKSSDGRMVLREARVHETMFDLYDFGALDYKIRNSNTLLVNALYTNDLNFPDTPSQTGPRA